MDVQEIVAELKTERERLNQAIATLEDLGSGQETAKSRTPIKTAAVGNMRRWCRSSGGKVVGITHRRASN